MLKFLFNVEKILIKFQILIRISKIKVYRSSFFQISIFAHINQNIKIKINLKIKFSCFNSIKIFLEDQFTLFIKFWLSILNNILYTWLISL